MAKAAHPARKSRDRVLKSLFFVICLFNVPVHDHHAGVRRQAVCNTLGDIEGSLLVLKDIVEVPAALSPEFFRLVFSHDKEGCREAVRQNALIAYDRGGDQSAVRRISGAGIDDMVIAHAVFFKVSLVAAGGDNRLVLHIQNPQIFQGALGILYGDSPGLSIQLGSERLDVASQTDDSAADPVAAEDLSDTVAGVALGDAAQVDLHAFGFEGNRWS